MEEQVKRSEMIQIMIQADREQSACLSLYSMMSGILNAMEDAGMLAPDDHLWEVEDV